MAKPLLRSITPTYFQEVTGKREGQKQLIYKIFASCSHYSYCLAMHTIIITVRDPFDSRQERDLEFYFEEWIRFSFDEQV